MMFYIKFHEKNTPKDKCSYQTSIQNNFKKLIYLLKAPQHYLRVKINSTSPKMKKVDKTGYP